MSRGCLFILLALFALALLSHAACYDTQSLATVNHEQKIREFAAAVRQFLLVAKEKGWDKALQPLMDLVISWITNALLVSSAEHHPEAEHHENDQQQHRGGLFGFL